jgi:adenylate cyclase
MRLPSLSVGTKLAVLVALPVALTAAAVPLLFSALHDELISVADDQVEGAERAFQIEMDDDLTDLVLTARALAAHPETRRALETGDVRAALEVAGIFAGLYPHTDVLVAARDGRVLGDVGPSPAPARLDEIPELAQPLGPGAGEWHSILPSGCAAPARHAGPARAVAAPVGGLGHVLVCAPLDRAYVDNAASKLGLELAVLDGPLGRVPSATTARFPAPALAAAPGAVTLLRDGARLWAVQRFVPRQMAGLHGGKMEVVAAVDLTAVRASVRRHLFAMLGFLALVAVLVVALGLRLAGMMSRGLHAVIGALPRVERQEYAHVPVVETGDEIERLVMGFNRMVDGLAERDKLRTTFGKYMTESVLEHLLAGKVELGGEKVVATILFSDIRSFTTISEGMDAQALVALLNEYFTEMVGIVIGCGGVVDKYIGDAIMAVFGPPVPAANDALNAVRAAVGMRAALARLNQRLVARGTAPLRAGIGIHTGEVVAGNIGSEQRMEYTVIGDAVNLASRLESQTKEAGADILISDATYELTRRWVLARPRGEVRVKGRVQPAAIYEVLGMSEGDADPLAT